ncbi:MAG: KH domain-containing protein [Coriobacteriia bacterium]|nr:KH domain-containing protein [Coriobacteriia bacterium]MBN2841051.1 KH domain-containing protein [Coriobacteriia bacterium]
MIDEVTVEGPSVEEAIDSALDQMGVQQDAVQFEVLAEPGRGLFKGGSAPARVRVWLKPGMEFDRGVESEDELEEVQPDVDTDASAGLTDEELDAIADAGADAIRAILSSLGVEGSIDEYEGDEGEIILDITGDDLAVLIGRHGRTLDALQVIVSTITNRKLDMRYPLVVDVSGYRHRRRLKLEEIARGAADRAVRQRRSVQLRPMSSFERRVIHVVLREDKRVSTESEGAEPRRMVVVHPR